MPPRCHAPGVDADDIRLILAQVAEPVWHALRGQRLFITGGTGFVGCWLLEALLAADAALGLGLELTVLSRDPARFAARAPHLAAGVRLVAGDMASLQHIDGAWDSVIHAATDVAGPAADPLPAFHQIVAGTEQTLALARRCGARRYLLVSSGAVYGQQPDDCPHVPETYAGAPDCAVPANAYGQGKRVAEWLASCHAATLDIKIARCFALVGPYLPLDAHFAIGNFIRDALAGGPIRIGGDGMPWRSYLYAADLAVWLLTILVRGDARPYNVGAEQGLPLAQLAELVSQTLDANATLQIAHRAPPGQVAQRYVPATARAAALGLRAYTDLPSAIRKTADWHQRRLHHVA